MGEISKTLKFVGRSRSEQKRKGDRPLIKRGGMKPTRLELNRKKLEDRLAFHCRDIHAFLSCRENTPDSRFIEQWDRMPHLEPWDGLRREYEALLEKQAGIEWWNV